MKRIAVIADSWNQFAARHANHGFTFNVLLGTAHREASKLHDKPALLAVYINAQDVAFTCEQSQGLVYDDFVNLSSSANEDVLSRVVSQTRSLRRIA